MNTFVTGFFVVMLVSALSVVGMIVVRRMVGFEKLRSFNEVAGNSFQVVGTFYAVLLGLIVVDAMSSVSGLRSTIEQEANAVGDNYILARALPEPQRKQLQTLCVNYVDLILNEEWDAMKEGKVSGAAVSCMNEMWDEIIDIKPTSDGENDIRQMLLSNMAELGDNRRARLIVSQHGVSAEMWTVLIIGGALTIAFFYFLGLPSLIGQILMTIVIATTITLNIYLVYLFGYPLSGAYSIAPEAFLADKIIFNLRSGQLSLPSKTFNPRSILER